VAPGQPPGGKGQLTKPRSDLFLIHSYSTHSSLRSAVRVQCRRCLYPCSDSLYPRMRSSLEHEKGPYYRHPLENVLITAMVSMNGTSTEKPDGWVTGAIKPIWDRGRGGIAVWCCILGYACPGVCWRTTRCSLSCPGDGTECAGIGSCQSISLKLYANGGPVVFSDLETAKILYANGRAWS
jgi:hypothetical protein